MTDETIPLYVCMGSNADDAEGYLDSAEAALEKAGLHAAARSRTYLTEPQDDKDQNWFRNRAVRFDIPKGTGMRSTARAVLALLQETEDALGRKRDPARRFGPRTIDLDILLLGSAVLNEPDLVIPHPRLAQRAFALVPLLEIEPGCRMPDGTPCAELLARLKYVLDNEKIFQ